MMVRLWIWVPLAPKFEPTVVRPARLANFSVFGKACPLSTFIVQFLNRWSRAALEFTGEVCTEGEGQGGQIGQAIGHPFALVDLCR
jgi:hypothetical protein